MKRIYIATLIAAALSLPLLSQAETANTATTRAQIRAELVAAEQAGQYPQSDAHYPDAAPDAALTYVADRAAARAAAEASYGTSDGGRSESGLRHSHVHGVTHAQPDNLDIYRGQ